MEKAVSLFRFLTLLCLLLFAAPAWAAEPEKEAVSDPVLDIVAGEEKEDKSLNPVTDAWENLWSGQQARIQEIRDNAIQLSDNFSRQTDNLAHRLHPFEEESRKLLVFANSFKGHPHPMEAIMWRISVTLNELNEALLPVHRARSEAQTLLEQVNHMASSLPDDVDRSRFSPEMREYIDSIMRARLRLTAVLTQYDTLLPSLSLVSTLEKTRNEISRDLPTLWKDYYLQKPVAWLTPATWERVPLNFYYSWQIMLMRMPVEMPTTWDQWGACILRFFFGLAFGGVLVVILRRRWLNRHSPQALKNIFDKSGPWLVLGSAFLGSALSATGDFFRFFIATGSCCLIIGEMILAWNLRLLQYPDSPDRRSPFLRMVPLVLWAYALLYLPLPRAVILVTWLAVLIFAMIRHKKWRRFTDPRLQLETGIRDCYSIILWPCLFLVMSGFQIYSMALYLAYVALALATELSLGGMSVVSRINEHLPQEGASAVLARLGVALAAPCVLVLAVAGASLWVIILPGGTYLLSQYALKGITVGATQFNIIQILVVISAFYLTRTIVSMGTRFLAKLPSQGHFDATLITPMQTALTYITWAVFGLFALHSVGMSLSNLAMVAGGLSVGIGFGMQTIVNNFLSGLILIFGRTLQVGDVIEVGGTTGRVRKISVRSTMVETYDNAIIYVPNSQFMSSNLTNWTSFSRSVRKHIDIGVAYGSDTEEVIRLLIDVAKQHKNVLQAPSPSVIFMDFGASSLDFRLRFWVRDYEMGASTSSDLRLGINRVFNEHGIEISFPQLDVHVRDSAPIPFEEVRQTPPSPDDAGAKATAEKVEKKDDRPASDGGEKK